MPKRVLAAFLVLLAASPFSAPFQTCDLFHTTTADESLQVEAATSPTSDAGSLVAPIRTPRGRLTVAVLPGLNDSDFVSSPVAAPPECGPPPLTANAAARPTILRV